MATGIDFNVEGVHKKRLAVTYADSSAGTGDWIFYRDQGNNVGLKISSAGYVTKPATPAFFVNSSPSHSNFTGYDNSVHSFANVHYNNGKSLQQQHWKIYCSC